MAQLVLLFHQQHTIAIASSMTAQQGITRKVRDPSLLLWALWENHSLALTPPLRMPATLPSGWGITLTQQMGLLSLPYLPISCLFLRILRAPLLLIILPILLPSLIRRPRPRPRPRRNQAGVFRFEQQPQATMRSEEQTSQPQ